MSGFSGDQSNLKRFKKLRIRPQDISMAPQSKRMVDDMSPEKLSEVIKDMTNGNITLDVRRLQAALFMS